MKKVLTSLIVFLLVLGVTMILILTSTMRTEHMAETTKAGKEEVEIKPSAVAATVSASKLTVNPGETFDVSVVLTDNSIRLGNKV